MSRRAKAPTGFVGHTDKARLKVDWQTPDYLLQPVRDYFGGEVPFDAATAIDNPCGALEFAARPLCARAGCGHRETDHLTQEEVDKLNAKAAKKGERLLLEGCQACAGTCEEYRAGEQLQAELVNGGRHVSLDGLAYEWPRRVWCNPPYGKHTREWLPKLGAAAAEGREIVALLSCARWEQPYFMSAFRRVNALCFIERRVDFVNPSTGDAVSGNTYANMFLGFNCSLPLWRLAFRHLEDPKRPRRGECFELRVL